MKNFSGILKLTERIRSIPGCTFGRWKVVKIVGVRRYARTNDYLAKCRCSCGTVRMVSITSLRQGNSRSCGCLRAELARRRTYKHGCANRTPEYSVWQNMIARCSNPRNKRWLHYGGRGVRVCRRWKSKHGFENFLADMALRPSFNHTLDRKNNNGDYCPSNCHWATRKEQSRNKSNSRKVTFRGRTKLLIDWAEELGINYRTLRTRLFQLKWSVEKTLTTPIKAHA